MSNVCRAVSWTSDGVPHRCYQRLISEPQSGHTLCHYHDKLAQNIGSPAPTNYADERVEFITLAASPNTVIWRSEEGVCVAEEFALAS